MANNTPGSERPWMDSMRRKKKRRLTPRMVKYAQKRAEGHPPAAAAREAGYASPYRAGGYLESSNNMVNFNRDTLANSGVTPTLIGDKIREGLDAMRAVYVLIQDERSFEHPPGTKEGDEERRLRDREPKKTLIKEEDWHGRHKYVETAIAMAGLRPEVQTKLMIEAQMNVDVTHTHLVVPVVTGEMLESLASMTPEEKARAITDRARKRLTGTLLEEPVELKPLEARVADLPPSNTDEGK